MRVEITTEIDREEPASVSSTITGSDGSRRMRSVLRQMLPRSKRRSRRGCYESSYDLSLGRMTTSRVYLVAIDVAGTQSTIHVTTAS